MQGNVRNNRLNHLKKTIRAAAAEFGVKKPQNKHFSKELKYLLQIKYERQGEKNQKEISADNNQLLPRAKNQTLTNL